MIPLPGNPVPSFNPDHQPVITPAGMPPYCTCGQVGGNGFNRPLLADHLRENDPGYGRRSIIPEAYEPDDDTTYDAAHTTRRTHTSRDAHTA